MEEGRNGKPDPSNIAVESPNLLLKQKLKSTIDEFCNAFEIDDYNQMFKVPEVQELPRVSMESTPIGNMKKDNQPMNKFRPVSLLRKTRLGEGNSVTNVKTESITANKTGAAAKTKGAEAVLQLQEWPG